MSRIRMSILALVAHLSLILGCSDGTVGRPPVTEDVSASEMADVALDSDTLTEQALSAQLTAIDSVAASTTGDEGGSGTVTRDATFSITRPCPGGGQVQVEGMIHATLDRETRTMEAEASGSRTRTDCVFHRNDHTVTVNGAALWEASRRRVEGRPDGPQTTHYAGSWIAVRDDGEERSCEFDITVVRNPNQHTRSLDGVICGTEIHKTVTWSGDGE